MGAAHALSGASSCAVRSARPAVTEQSAYDASGDPFPTTYYVTCPQLVAAISRLEAAGGVERWSEAAQHEPALAESLARATAEQRRVRAELAAGELGPDAGASLDLGIGGSRNPEQLKCLHAHVAFALARPGLRARRADRRGDRPTLAANLLHEHPRRGRIIGRSVMSAVAVEHARQQWEEGHRRLQSYSVDRPLFLQLHAQVRLVVDELNRRVGQTFTLSELANAYHEADRWAYDVLARSLTSRSSRTPRFISMPAAQSTTPHEAATAAGRSPAAPNLGASLCRGARRLRRRRRSGAGA